MNLTILLPLLFSIGGALVYGFAANPKALELGRLSYFAGLLAFLLAVSGKALHLTL